ncbi:hypothetical protein CR513_45362, partial [Mucuna pruriens]
MAWMSQIPSQTNAAITTMANYGAIGHAQVGNIVGPPPHKVEAQCQAPWTTRPLMAHKQTPRTKDKWQSLEE